MTRQPKKTLVEDPDQAEWRRRLVVARQNPNQCASCEHWQQAGQGWLGSCTLQLPPMLEEVAGEKSSTCRYDHGCSFHT
jgi:hypothetical protein